MVKKSPSGARCGHFTPFEQFSETLGHFFLEIYLLLGAFGAQLLFTGGDFLLEVINSWVLFVDNWALFHSNHPVTLNTTQIFFFF